MKKFQLFLLAMALPLMSFADTVFDDTFTTGNDTVQQAAPPAPTGTYSSYEYFQQGGAPTTPTLTGTSLHLAGRTTSSSISEVEALFAASPIALLTVGDYINLTVTFTNTQNIFPAGSASTLNFGLFNSGGASLNQGARLDSTTYLNGGGSQGWAGYVGRIHGGAASSIYTRAPQGTNGTTSQTQDLLFNGASGSAAFNNPGGTTIGTGSQFTAGLTGGSIYTLELQIVLSAEGTLTISNALYSGSLADSGNILFSQIAVATGGSYLTNSFDGFALGWRYNSTSAANSIDITHILVTDFIQPVPEPSVIALSGIAFLGLMAIRRQRK